MNSECSSTYWELWGQRGAGSPTARARETQQRRTDTTFRGKIVRVGDKRSASSWTDLGLFDWMAAKEAGNSGSL